MNLSGHSYLQLEEAPLMRSGAMVYRHSPVLLGGVLVLCSLSRIIVVGFPLGSMTSISSLRFLASLTVLGMVSI